MTKRVDLFGLLLVAAALVISGCGVQEGGKPISKVAAVIETVEVKE